MSGRFWVDVLWAWGFGVLFVLFSSLSEVFRIVVVVADGVVLVSVHVRET